MFPMTLVAMLWIGACSDDSTSGTEQTDADNNGGFAGGGNIPEDCTGIGCDVSAFPEECGPKSCPDHLVGTACDDHNLCTNDETWQKDGTCGSGENATCDDGNPCTVDECQSDQGCVFITSEDNQKCDDGLPIT